MTWITDAQNTWCPGCGNFAVQHALKDVFAGLVAAEGRRPEEFVLVAGIGCHAKIADYLAVNSFYAIHGRTLPVAAGITLANPGLTVVACAGDGDAYAEGLGHLVFAAKRNTNITAIVHDNRVYGLTTGQYTPTSYTGFKGRSTPSGVKEHPFNPVDLALASGATFVARSYTRRLDHLREVLRRAVLHQGFSFVEVLQICATYNNLTASYHDQVYELEGEDHDVSDLDAARARAREWDYTDGGPIPLGVFYEVDREREVWQTMGRVPDHRRRQVIRGVLEERR